MYFKVTIESGDIEDGTLHESVCYVEADSTDDLFTMMKDYPGLKSNEKSKGISMIKPLDKQKYETEKILEWKREYISRLRI